jgi:hypothetical protein
MSLVPAFGFIALLAGCSFLSTTADGVSATVDSMTQATSTTFASSTGDDASKSAFVNTRIEAIRFEAARGEGEHLDSLAALLGEPDRAAFARWMKDNYGQLFAGLREPQELLTRIEQRRGSRS